MVEIDLAEAERTVRADHYQVCRWPHTDIPGRCVGDCEMVCYADGEVWPCAADMLLAEYDRRGQIEQRAQLVAEGRPVRSDRHVALALSASGGPSPNQAAFVASWILRGDV